MFPATPVQASPKLISKTNWLMVGAILAVGVANLLWAEIIRVGGGFGWDGQLYGTLAQTFPEALQGRTINAYYLQRLLPSAIVHYGLRISGCSASIPDVVRGFEILNLCCLGLIALAWGNLADRLGLGWRGKWFGFIAFFCNFHFLKHGAYCPVSTDTPAFTVALLMLAAYLKDRLWELTALTLLGSFVWPLLIYLGAGLMIFPRGAIVSRDERRPWSYLFAAALSAAAAGSAAYLYFIGHFRPDGSPVVAPLILISLLLLGIYLFLATRPLLAGCFFTDLKLQLTLRRLSRVALAGCIVLAVSWVVVHCASGVESPTTGYGYNLKETLIRGIVRPLNFLLAHVLFYGPIVILAVFFWRRCCAHVLQAGRGLALALLAGVILSVNSESRRECLIFIPLLVPYVVKAVDECAPGRWFYVMFGLISLLYSKVWLSVNAQLRPEDAAYQAFPWQKFFGSIGCWMSTEMYLLQGAITVGVAALLYTALFKGRGRAAAAAGSSGGP
jgi:hypothetical protein